jgi:hypothetical protein
MYNVDIGSSHTSLIVSLILAQMPMLTKPFPMYYTNTDTNQPFFFLGKIHQENEIINQKFKNEVILGGFQLTEMTKKIVNIARFLYLIKNRKKKFYISYLIYSQFWLNLFKDDCHFLCTFLSMIAPLATLKHSPKNQIVQIIVPLQ